MMLPSGFVSGTFYHSLTPPAVAAALPALVTAFHRASERADLLRYAVAVSQKPSPLPEIAMIASRLPYPINASGPSAGSAGWNLTPPIRRLRDG